MSRTKKAPLTGAKRVDKSCRNHGTRPYCRGNRTRNAKRGESAAVLALREYLRTAPPAELAADWYAVEAMNIQGPTLSQLLQQQRARTSCLPLAYGAYDA